MMITILETGRVPDALAGQFSGYPDMMGAMFARDGVRFGYEVIPVHAGAPLPDPSRLDGVLITGSSAGVYEDHDWLGPLRDFIVLAYRNRTKMVGICFGHQIIADALGGDVRKSEKGWGAGRHSYRFSPVPPHIDLPRASLSLSCMHQDQVIVPPETARVFLVSDFTPNAGLVYENGAVMTVQPHPEFDDSYVKALIALRCGLITEPAARAALQSMTRPSDSALMARALSRFLIA